MFYFSNREQFYLYSSFISFSCLITLPRTFTKYRVKWEWWEWHSCLVLDIRGRAFSFSPLSIMLDIRFYFLLFVFVDALYHLEEVPCYSYLLRFLKSWMDVECCQMFLWHLIRWLYGVSSLSVDNVNYAGWFLTMKPTLHFWEETPLGYGVLSFLNIAGIDLIMYCWEFFCMCVRMGYWSTVLISFCVCVFCIRVILTL